MYLLLLVIMVFLLWRSERRWHLVGRLNRRVGISLPLVALGYVVAVLPMLLIPFRHRGVLSPGFVLAAPHCVMSRKGIR